MEPSAFSVAGAALLDSGTSLAAAGPSRPWGKTCAAVPSRFLGHAKTRPGASLRSRFFFSGPASLPRLGLPRALPTPRRTRTAAAPPVASSSTRPAAQQPRSTSLRPARRSPAHVPSVPLAAPVAQSSHGCSERQVTTLIQHAKTVDEALDAFQILPRSGRKNNIIHHNALLKALCRTGAVERARKLLESMEAARDVEAGGGDACPPDLLSYNTLAAGYAGAGRVGEAQALLERMRAAGLQPDAVSYSTVINACTRAEPPRMDLAQQTLREMDRAGVRPNLVTYNTLIHGFGRAGMADEALATLRTLAGELGPDATSWNGCLDACFRAGRPEAARALFERMERPPAAAGPGPPPARPNAVTYATMVGGLCDAGEPGAARDILARLAAEGAPPALQATASAALLDGLVRARDHRALSESFAACERAGLADGRHFTAAVKGLARAGRAGEAEERLREARRRGHAAGEALFGAVVDAHLAARDGPAAERVLWAQREAGVPCTDAVRLTAVLRAGAPHARAMAVFRELGSGWLAGLRPDLRLYTALLESCARDRNALDARAVFAAAPSPDAVLCGVMMRAYVRSGLPGEALALFHSMRRDRHLAPTAACYAAAVDAATRSGAAEGTAAAGLVREMRRAGHRPSARLYNVAIRGQGRLGRSDAAFALYDDMRAAGVQPTALTLSSLMVACVRAGEPGRALPLLPAIEALPAGERLDVRAYNGLLRCMAERGCPPEDALALLRHLSALETRPDEETARALVAVCVGAGRADEALDALRAVRAAGVRPPPVAYTALVRALAGSQREAALGLLADMRGAGGNRDRRQEASAYGALVESFAASDDPIRALLGLREMTDAGLVPPRGAYERLIASFSGSERVDEAFAVFRMMEGAPGGPTPRAYGALIQALVRGKQTLRATLGLRDMEARGLRPALPTYDSLVQRLGEAQELDAAFAVLRRMRESYPRAPARPDTYAALVEACAGRGLLLKAVLGVAELQRSLDAGSSELPAALREEPGLRRAYSAALAAVTQQDAAEGYELYRAVRQRWGLDPDDAALALLLSASLTSPAPPRPLPAGRLLLPSPPSAAPDDGDERELLLLPAPIAAARRRAAH